MPPDFDKLPKPGEANIKSTKDIQSDQSNIENLLKNSKMNKKMIIYLQNNQHLLKVQY